MLGVAQTYISYNADKKRIAGITSYDGQQVAAITFSFSTEYWPSDTYSFLFDRERPKQKMDTVGVMPYARLAHDDFSHQFNYMAAENSMETVRANLPARLRLSLDRCVQAMQPLDDSLDGRAA